MISSLKHCAPNPKWCMDEVIYYNPIYNSQRPEIFQISGTEWLNKWYNIHTKE